MSQDPTRATRSPEEIGRAPRHGSVGPDDPHADPVTDPGMRPVGRGQEPPTVAIRNGAEPPTAPVPTQRDDPRRGTRTGGRLWTGLILSALVLIVLLVFILQNLDPVEIRFLGFVGELPAGVALLLAAVAGLLLVAIPGALRARAR